LDAGVDKLTKGGGEVATVGLGGEQLNIVQNMDMPQIASRSGASGDRVAVDAILLDNSNQQYTKKR
jgi:hypothetical protein